MKRGFSLIELVIATAISAFIVLIVYQVVDQVRRNTERLEDTAEYCDVVIRLEQEFERTLVGMIVPNIPLEAPITDQKPTTTAAAPQKESAQEKPEQKKKISPFFAEMRDGRLERMSCVTVNPLAVYNAVSPVPVRVLYRLERSSDEVERYRLVRQELRDLMLEDRDEQKSAPVYEILDNVISFSVRCVMPDDESKEEKKPTFKEQAPWGMADEKHQEILPHAVIIECGWRSGERTHTHTIYTRIPSAAWYTERTKEQKKEPEPAKPAPDKKGAP